MGNYAHLLCQPVHAYSSLLVALCHYDVRLDVSAVSGNYRYGVNTRQNVAAIVAATVVAVIAPCIHYSPSILPSFLTYLFFVVFFYIIIAVKLLNPRRTSGRGFTRW